MTIPKIVEVTGVKAIAFGHGSSVPGIEYLFGPDFMMKHRNLEGRRVRVTIEFLDDEPGDRDES